MSMKFTTMSEGDFDDVYLNGRRNLVNKRWSSADCTGTVNYIAVMPENSANGNCFENPQGSGSGSALVSWTDKKRIIRFYDRSDCRGIFSWGDEINLNSGECVTSNTSMGEIHSEMWSTTTASANLIVWKVYMQPGCNEASLFQVLKFPSLKLGCNNGHEMYVSGNLLKQRTWQYPNCSGTAGNSTTVDGMEINNNCIRSGNSSMFINSTTMSEGDFDDVYLNGRGNLVNKHWSSANCTGTVNYIAVFPENPANGKCFENPQGSGSALFSWTDKKRITRFYNQSDCRGIFSREDETNLNSGECVPSNTSMGGIHSETWSTFCPRVSLSCTAKKYSGEWPVPKGKGGCKTIEEGCASLQPWECDGQSKYRDQCMYNSHPDYSRMCLVPSNYNGSHLFSIEGTCNALMSWFSSKGKCLENVNWNGTNSEIQNGLIEVEGKVIGGTNCRDLLHRFLGPSCCGSGQKIATVADYSRTCLNPEKYDHFVSYEGMSCNTIYQELSSHGKRFSTIDWNNVRKSDFLDNNPNEKTSNETLLHFYSNTVMDLANPSARPLDAASGKALTKNAYLL
eukprot:g11096.t1